MNYDNALNLILQKQSLGIKPGLTRIYELLNKMDNPQDKINIIHIRLNIFQFHYLVL